jgi:hypothetical protein
MPEEVTEMPLRWGDDNESALSRVDACRLGGTASPWGPWVDLEATGDSGDSRQCGRLQTVNGLDLRKPT